MSKDKKIYIDGVECTISEVKPSSHDYSEVFVNNFSSRHLITSGLATFTRKFKIKTGGHIIEFKG